MINMILATDLQGCIGKDNKLCWYIPDDLRRFKMLTDGGVIIMGRKTFESLPGVLPNRLHIVISRSEDLELPEGVILVNSIEDAISLGYEKAETHNNKIFIIGGANIYEQTIKYTDKIYWTIVETLVEGDAFLEMETLTDGFEVTQSMVVKGPLDYCYKTLERNGKTSK